MVKAEIVNVISQKINEEKRVVQHIIEAFMDTIKVSLMEGDTVFLRGFGTFSLKLRKEKIGQIMARDKSSTPVVVPAHYIPFFKPGAELKDEVKLIKVKDEGETLPGMIESHQRAKVTDNKIKILKLL